MSGVTSSAWVGFSLKRSGLTLKRSLCRHGNPNRWSRSSHTSSPVLSSFWSEEQSSFHNNFVAGQSHRSGNRLHPGNVSSLLLQRRREEEGGRSAGPASSSSSSSWLRLQERMMESGAPPRRPVNETNWSNREPSCRPQRMFIHTYAHGFL